MERQSKLMMLFAVTLAVVLILLCARVISPSAAPKERSTLEAEDAALRYPYQQLGERDRALYDALYQGIAAFEEEIGLPETYTDKEYERVYLLLTKQEPQFFYLESYYELAAEMESVRMYYTVSQEQAAEMQKQLDAAAERVLKQISPTQTEAQKLLLIYNSIGAACQYGAAGHSDDAYGCLVQGVAQCEGYAKAFLYLARRAGISAMCVTGESARGVAHVWNIAQIDGAYYQFDVTWDDDDVYCGRTAHCCFAVPDSLFSDHITDTAPYIPPVCSGMWENYYQKKGYVLTEADQLAGKLQEWLGQSDGMLEFRAADAQVYQAVSKAMQSDPNVSALMKTVLNGRNWQLILDKTRQVVVILW